MLPIGSIQPLLHSASILHPTFLDIISRVIMMLQMMVLSETVFIAVIHKAVK